MFCNKCGNEVADGAQFCPKCGAEFKKEQELQKEQEVKKEQELQKEQLKKKKKYPFVLAIGLVVVLAVAGGGVYKANTPEFKYQSLINKAEKYVEAQKYEEALETYEQAAEIMGSQVGLEEEFAACYEGFAEENFLAGEYEKALEWYDAALEKIRDRETAINGKTDIYVVLGEKALAGQAYEQAAGYFTEATALNSRSEAAWLGAVNSFLLQGKVTEALEKLEEAASESGESAVWENRRQTVLAHTYASAKEQYDWEDENTVLNRWQYDEAGNLFCLEKFGVDDGNKDTYHYTYDEQNRVITEKRIYSTGTGRTVNTTYGADGGRRCEASNYDENGILTGYSVEEYDSEDRKLFSESYFVSEGQPQYVSTKEVSEYDENGVLRAEIVYRANVENGNALEESSREEYNSQGILVTDSSILDAEGRYIGYYKKMGTYTQTNLPDDPVECTVSYDENGRIKEIRVEVISDITKEEYNNAKVWLSPVRTGNVLEYETYEYDQNGLLTRKSYYRFLEEVVYKGSNIFDMSGFENSIETVYEYELCTEEERLDSALEVPHIYKLMTTNEYFPVAMKENYAILGNYRLASKTTINENGETETEAYGNNGEVAGEKEYDIFGNVVYEQSQESNPSYYRYTYKYTGDILTAE